MPIATLDVVATIKSLPEILEFINLALIDRVAQAELAARVASPATLDLVGLWLSRTPGRGVGVPQGGPISPLLSNLYLDPVDRLIDSRRTRLVRYADNILILATEKRAAACAGARLAVLLSARGLALNPAKTRLVRLDDHFEFLGHRIGGAVHVG